MQQYICLLRGINVGGRRKVLMSDLKLLFQELGAREISHYIQSGNIIFKHKENNPEQLNQKISQQIKVQYQFEVPVVILKSKDVKNIIHENPFIKTSSVEQLHLVFLKDLPAKELVITLTQQDHAPDQFRIMEQAIFLRCEKKYSASKLNNQFFEKQLKITATTRNWKTVLRLNQMADESK